MSVSAYIYIIYTPNLGSEIAVPGREREQGRFRGSTGGARRSTERARGSTEGAPEGAGGALREHYGAVLGRRRWEPEMAALIRLQLPSILKSRGKLKRIYGLNNYDH